jgi:hypothetical protein
LDPPVCFFSLEARKTLFSGETQLNLGPVHHRFPVGIGYK